MVKSSLFVALNCVFLAAVCLLIVSGIKNSAMDVTLKRFQNCEDYPSLRMMFKDVGLSQVAKKKFALNGGLNLDVAVTRSILASVTITKCEDSSGDDSCEYIGTAREEEFCDKIGQEGTPWNKFMKETEIGTDCPIKPGNYSVVKAPLDLEDAEGITLSPGYWKLRMEVFNESDADQKGTDPIGCNVVEVAVTPSRGNYRN